MKIISWNLNGIRSVIKKELFFSFINKELPDIICLQEVRATYRQFSFSDEFNEKYQYQIFNDHQTKKGYSGTAIFSKIEPMNIIRPDFDTEGRVIIAEFQDYFLVCVYVPNGGSRFDYRIKEWDIIFREYLKTLVSKKIIICGDFNVAHNSVDIHNPKIKNVDGVIYANCGCWTEKDNCTFLYENKNGELKIGNYSE